MIKLRAHETDITAAINGLVNDINIEVGALSNDFATLQRAVASALVDLHKRLTALEPELPKATPVPPAAPDAPVPTL